MKPNLFNSVKMTKTPANSFDLSHDVKLSAKMGWLVPTACIEAVPGDIFGISCESLLRFAPLLAPIMHRVDVTMHYFFCPNRILWPQWEEFITNTKVGSPAALPVPPFVELSAVQGNNRLPNYLGIPRSDFAIGTLVVSALPFAAYQRIWNDFYRDQNLISELAWITAGGLSNGNNIANIAELITMRLRAWEHDYFTSSLPFAQKGDSVDIPLGDVRLKPLADLLPGQTQTLRKASDYSLLTGVKPLQEDTGFLSTDDNPNPDILTLMDPNSTWDVDATTINDLRLAFRLQEYLEKQARGGTRYIENILAHFGVRSSDKRLQRPEYITGIKSPVSISEVLNTTGTVDDPQGNMSGHGVAVTTGNYGRFFCEEHGFIMGIMSVTPKTAYQNGLHKMWSRLSDPTEYYFPTFANIGEQEVKNKEIFAWQGINPDNATFGYVPRYAEYKFIGNRVAGDFQTSLDFWHLGRKFTATPLLNQSFIECNPSDRIFAVQDAVDNLWVQVYHRIKAIRRMPKFGIPSF